MGTTYEYVYRIEVSSWSVDFFPPLALDLVEVAKSSRTGRRDGRFLLVGAACSKIFDNFLSWPYRSVSRQMANTPYDDVSNASHFLFSLFFFFPLLASIVCPTGPHPPLRLARRPNRGHTEGGGLDPLLQYIAVMFSSRAGFSAPHPRPR